MNELDTQGLIDDEEYREYPCCPICYSENIEDGKFYHEDCVQSLTRELRCIDCNATWKEDYELVGYRLSDPPSHDAPPTIKKMTPEEEAELAEALEHYTDPDDPEYDEEFDKQIRALRPDWFDPEATGG